MSQPSDEAMEVALANYSHSAWAGWMKYMFSKGAIQPDGIWVMPKESVERWQRQMNTPYSYLVKSEQKSDIEEARKIMAIVDDHIAPLRAEVEALRAGRGNLESIYRHQELTEIVAYLQNVIAQTPVDGENDRFIAGVRYAISAIKSLDL